MSQLNLLARGVLVAIAIVAALVSMSCQTPGVGVGMDYPARWGGTNGPPVFVGGPAY